MCVRAGPVLGRGYRCVRQASTLGWGGESVPCLVGRVLVCMVGVVWGGGGRVPFGIVGGVFG